MLPNNPHESPSFLDFLCGIHDWRLQVPSPAGEYVARIRVLGIALTISAGAPAGFQPAESELRQLSDPSSARQVADRSPHLYDSADDLSAHDGAAHEAQEPAHEHAYDVAAIQRHRAALPAAIDLAQQDLARATTGSERRSAVVGLRRLTALQHSAALALDAQGRPAPAPRVALPRRPGRAGLRHAFDMRRIASWKKRRQLHQAPPGSVERYLARQAYFEHQLELVRLRAESRHACGASPPRRRHRRGWRPAPGAQRMLAGLADVPGIWDEFEVHADELRRMGAPPPAGRPVGGGRFDAGGERGRARESR